MIPVWSPMSFRYLYMSFRDYAGLYTKHSRLCRNIHEKSSSSFGYYYCIFDQYR